MAVVISEADRLTRFSKDMLKLCKLDSTTIIEKKETFSPAAQIRSILLDYQVLWGEKKIEVEPELEEFEITSNEALLFRVWQNIIHNAIKFTGQGGRISLRLERVENVLTCKVSDTGIGISEEDKQHILRHFTPGASLTIRRKAD